MNRTMLSVIALAVGAVLIIGLYNIYKPKVNTISHDVFDKFGTSVQHASMSKKPIKTGSIDGLSYSDWGHGNIEFTKGTIDNSGNGWHWTYGLMQQANTPKDVKDATSIKFDGSVDVSHARNLHNLLGFDSNLRSVDLGNLDTSGMAKHGNDNYIYSMYDMFSDDPNLENVTVGPKFGEGVPESRLGHMFSDDPKLKSISGNPSAEVQNAFHSLSGENNPNGDKVTE